MSIVKMNDTQQKVLNIISKSRFIVKNLKNKKKMIEEEGVITNQELLQKLKDRLMALDLL